MKKILATVLLVALMLSMLTACGAKSNTTENTTPVASLTRSETGNRETNSLTLSLNSTCNTLDPHNFALNVENTVINDCYEQLFVQNSNSELVPLLAETVEPAEDGSSVTFTLRQGVKFHNGDELTMEDVVFSIGRLSNSALAQPIALYSEIEVVDDTTLILNFPAFDQGAGFYELISYFPIAYIVDKSWVEEQVEDPLADFGLVENGTGAYVLDDIAANGDLSLSRFEEYWGEASIDTVNYKIITGDRAMAFEAGDIDSTGLEFAQYQRFASEFTNVNFIEQAANYVFFICCNCADGVMDDINVRKAASYAMNRTDLAIIASDNAGAPAYNLANPLVTYYDDCCEHYDNNLEEAQKLMSAAGYSESNKAAVEIIVMSAVPPWVSAAEIAKEQLDAAYFDVTITEVSDTSRYFTQDFDLGMIGIGLTTNFGGFSLLFDNESGLNLSGLDGEEQEAVLNAFAAIKDEESAHEAMKAVVDSFAYIPVYYTMTYVGFDENLNHGDFYADSSLLFTREMSWN